jgi:hypothetical protein
MKPMIALLCFALVNCTATKPQNVSVSELRSQPHVLNYAFFGRDRERISERSFLDSPVIVGAQLTYAWKELEPDHGVYDFSKIEQDLHFLRRHGKKLFIQLQDTTFNPNNAAVPDFLRIDPQFGGGVVFQYDSNGAPEGLVAMRWHPLVRRQFQGLLKALGQKFDGKIAGINLQETSVGIEESDGTKISGFTYNLYRDAILDNMKALKQALPTSVVMQYANFMPGEWLPGDDKGFLESVYQFGRDNGVAVGAPDLMPGRLPQLNHAYRFMSQYKGAMVLGVAVQDGNYTGATGHEVSSDDGTSMVPELDHFARGRLGVQFIFWGAQEPYFSRDVVPYLNR